MAHDLQALFGSVIPETDLALPKAAAVVRYARHPDVQYGQVVECRRGASGQEIVILDLRIEVPQRPVAPIESTERIGVIFSRADNHYPDVLCLRESFPDVPHLNLRPATEPKSICLYLEPYHDLKL